MRGYLGWVYICVGKRKGRGWLVGWGNRWMDLGEGGSLWLGRVFPSASSGTRWVKEVGALGMVLVLFG